MPLRNGLPLNIVPVLAATFVEQHGEAILYSALLEGYGIEQMVGYHITKLQITRRGDGVAPFINEVVRLLNARVAELETEATPDVKKVPPPSAPKS